MAKFAGPRQVWASEMGTQATFFLAILHVCVRDAGRFVQCSQALYGCGFRSRAATLGRRVVVRNAPGIIRLTARQ